MKNGDHEATATITIIRINTITIIIAITITITIIIVIVIVISVAIREGRQCAECTAMKPGSADTKFIYWKTSSPSS